MASVGAEKSIVHIVDDDEALRTAVGRLLRAAGYEVCTYASAGEFALALNGDLTGCVLLDVRMPGPSGLDLQASLARGHNSLPVIFLTGHGDIPMSVHAMKAGAVDFLTKPVQRAKLLEAVRTGLAKEEETRALRARLTDWRERFERLTPRERDVFERVTAGQPNKQIASETATAERTVKAHRAQVMEKMKAGSLAELVHVAEELHRAARR